MIGRDGQRYRACLCDWAGWASVQGVVRVIGRDGQVYGFAWISTEKYWRLVSGGGMRFLNPDRARNRDRNRRLIALRETVARSRSEPGAQALRHAEFSRFRSDPRASPMG